MRYLPFILFIFVITSHCMAETGRVCVSSVGQKTGEESAANPAGGSRKFSIQIDGSKIRRALPDTTILFDNLALNRKHWVKIRLDGKLYASFPFTFEKYGTAELCLWFNDFYRTWSLWKQGNAKRLCK
ncbi:MAG: hypothetical protein QUT30_14710 [Acidobacteriota bacterium]|nr:hypothetical protein [Acidobacteriota bacterium]